VDGPRDAGSHEVVWDGRNDRGARVASGVYFCRLEGSGLSVATKVVVLK